MTEKHTESRPSAWRRLARGWPKLHPRPRSIPTAVSAYAVAVVLFGFAAILKLVKAVHVARDGLSVVDIARILAADAALACAGLAVALILSSALRRVRGGAWWFAVVTTPPMLLLLELTALEHQTWAQSSSLLDWNVLWYTLAHYQELRPVIAAETTATGVLLLLGAALLAIAPLLTDLWVARVRGLELPAHSSRAGLALLCASLLAYLSTGSPRAPELCPLAQSASIGLIAGAFHKANVVADGSTHFVRLDAGHAAERLKQTLAAANFALDASASHPKNVLLLVLESTRFDATSVYAERLSTTPRLLELSQHGLVVDRAYVDMPHTSKALVSIVCGYSPRLSVQMNETEPGGLPRPCMPHVLSSLGYRSAFFQAAIGTFESRHQFALNAGFDDVFTRESYDETGFEEVNYLSVEDKVMLQPIMRFIDAQKQKPFFLTVLTCITHHNYGLPSRFPLRQYARQPAQPWGVLPNPWTDYNRYLNTVKYADELLGDLVDGLRERGHLDDTLIVVVGDHGQGFEEHGQRAHNTVIWDEGLRVPLVFANPKVFPEKRTVGGVRRQVDIAPTILSELGVSYPADFFEGRDLLTGPPHPYAYSACWYDNRCAAETGERTRFIDHFDRQPTEVYDLIADPSERRDLRSAGSSKERNRWDKAAKAARTRMRAHQHQLELRYEGEDDLQGDFLLKKAPTPTYPLHALAGDGVELLGYDTPTHQVVPDGFWDAIVYFRCIKPSVEGWRLFGALETQDGREEQVDHHPANGRLFLHQCKAGTFVADRIRVWIPGDFPPGEVRFWWGSVYLKQLGHMSIENPRVERGEITVLERGLLANDGAVLLAKLRVVPKYRPELAELLSSSVLAKPPKIDKPLEVRFGDHLVLLDARVTPITVRWRASVTVTTVWRVESKQDGPWQIAIDIIAHNKKVATRRAHTPVDGIHPIANWKPGTFVIDTDTIPVPDKALPGEATVWISLRASDDRMAVHDAGHAQVKDRRVFARKIEIEP